MKMIKPTNNSRMHQLDETMTNHMDDTILDLEITVAGDYQVHTEPTSPEVKRT